MRVLIDKSLVKIEDDRVMLHDLIQDMGREIVRQESEEPRGHSRIWNFEDAKRVLEQDKKFMNLRVLNFSNCQHLEQIPDLSVAPHLEELSFCWCKNLTEVHKSVGLLNKLRMLDAKGCCKLRSFPDLMLPALQQLRVSSCSSLESFPEILGKMESLTKLELEYTPIKEFPPSICYITRLERLELWHSKIVLLPTGGNEEDDLRRNQQQQFEAQAMKRMILAFRVLMGPGTRLGTKFRFATSASRCWLQRGIGGARSSLRLLNWRRKGLQDNYGSRS
ncbi:hypothetical protein Ahy_B06g082024 [Arachis hypogaea]|uniref:Disease resistance protein Roq1-like winged-helix domain-containing protein n=1 Tax=Arachis hypogaea TaxID=3818 RepID=A0A444YMV0_ARAHY|nr:hypothetical protein Ahy_B06g082024 [Arachis hypogaea]